MSVGKDVSPPLEPSLISTTHKFFVAAFRRNDALGNLLIITATNPHPGEPKLTISEQAWKGRIIPDLEYGSELCMIPAG